MLIKSYELDISLDLYLFEMWHHLIYSLSTN